MQERPGSEPHTRVRFFCSPYHQDSALYPAIAQLERAAGFRREDTAEQRLTKLEALLAQATNDVSGVVPLFADLLSIPTSERHPALNLTPQKRKEKTLQALVAQVEGLALRHPVLIIFEDIHWSDPTTRELLDLLIERVPKARLLTLITYRPEFSPPWVGLPHVTLVTLSRLPRQQRAEMISHMTGGKTLPREITDQIVERTDGVPLFIEELTKSVIESGVLANANDHHPAGPATLAIPTSLHASLLARLDRLAPTREVAQIGAALGRSFSHEVISAVAQMPQERVEDALEQLVNAELIFRRGTPPDAEYTFKHALVQDAAYSTLLRTRRQQLHARIAATLESRFPDACAAEANRLGRAFDRVYALGLFFCNWTVQPIEDTLRRAEAVSAIAVEHGFPMFQVLGTVVRGWCAASLGQPEEGITQLQQCVKLWRSFGAEVGVTLFLTFLADAYGKAGQPEEGLKQIAEAARSLELRNERVYEAEMHRIRGELFRSMQKASPAEASFRKGLAVARRQSAKLFELRTAMSMARLWRDQGKRDEARELLAPVYGWFTEGFDTRDLKEAKALLEELAP